MVQLFILTTLLSITALSAQQLTSFTVNQPPFTNYVPTATQSVNGLHTTVDNIPSTAIVSPTTTVSTNNNVAPTPLINNLLSSQSSSSITPQQQTILNNNINQLGNDVNRFMSEFLGTNTNAATTAQVYQQPYGNTNYIAPSQQSSYYQQQPAYTTQVQPSYNAYNNIPVQQQPQYYNPYNTQTQYNNIQPTQQQYAQYMPQSQQYSKPNQFTTQSVEQVNDINDNQPPALIDCPSHWERRWGIGMLLTPHGIWLYNSNYTNNYLIYDCVSYNQDQHVVHGHIS